MVCSRGLVRIDCNFPTTVQNGVESCTDSMHQDLAVPVPTKWAESVSQKIKKLAKAANRDERERERERERLCAGESARAK